jgi:hypothetical protein
MAKVTEQDMQDILREAIDNASYEAESEGTLVPELGNAKIRTFEEKGVLTSNKGLVIRLATGEEFQLTIVCSK